MSVTQLSYPAFAAAYAAAYRTPPVSNIRVPGVPAIVVAHGTGSAGECPKFFGLLPPISLSSYRDEFSRWAFEVSGWGLDAPDIASGSHEFSAVLLGDLPPWGFSVAWVPRP